MNRQNLSDLLSFWNFYNILNDLLLLAGSALCIYVIQTVGVNKASTALRSAEACLNGLAVTMSIMKLLYWCQLSSSLGPLAISIRRVFQDIAMVLTSYLIFFIAFTVGIHFIMSVPMPNEQNEPSCAKVLNVTDTDVKNMFVALFRGENESSELAWKTSLWAFFDPGHPEYLGCYYGFARSTAQILWGAYQVVNIVMLMPLMVALMSTTMNLIQGDKDKEWKFQRTEIWLRFFHNEGLPAPFNILDLLINIRKAEVKELKRKEERKR